MLDLYLSDPKGFFPQGYDEETLRKIRRTAGDLTCHELQLIRKGKLKKMYRYLAEQAKTLGEDQTNYP